MPSLKKPPLFSFDGPFDPKKIADGLYELWNQKKVFQAKNNKKPFSVVMAPPNLTGVLHLGHAWEISLSDLYLRYKRLQGFAVNWIPGYDHAGIATQTKYEKSLNAKQKQDYQKLPASLKVQAIWQWALDQGEIINSQIKLLGASVDWTNHRFTLDEKSSLAVNHAFKKLYDHQLIFKAKALVNWDLKLQTAISNIEVENKPHEQLLYYVIYQLSDCNDHLVVATTRPETIFADVALFVNPIDKRYKKYLKKTVINPLTKKNLPVLADSYVQMDFGSGVLKCTPGHDFNDYQLGKKYQLEELSAYSLDGKMNASAGKFAGMDRLITRQLVVEQLTKEKLLIKTEKIISNVGFSERTGEIVEPLLSTQWFIDLPKVVPDLKKAIIDKKALQIFPKRFLKLLTHWLAITDKWCISRQLVWGHQIPAWYHKQTKQVYVDVKPPKYLENYEQDQDVLDTWFSSSLWPLICFDWPNNNQTFQNGYPNNLMIMGFDIIFFWGIRMLFQGYFHTKKLPFKHLLVHGLIRDANGKKMSKSIGNVVDPIPLIEKYGSDALRICLTANTTPGEDSNFQTERLVDASNFLNKLWNASKYIFNLKPDQNITKKTNNSLADIWILNRLSEVSHQIAVLLDQYNFTLANKLIYNFVWNDFCNTYLELTKPSLSNNQKNHTIQVLRLVLEQIAIILHPFAPFLTERIYQGLKNDHNQFILNQSWLKKTTRSASAKQFDTIIEIITILRKFRSEANLVYKYPLVISLQTSKQQLINILKKAQTYFDAINCQIQSISETLEDDNQYALSFSQGFIVIHDEQLKQKAQTALDKQIEVLKNEVSRSQKILANKKFLEKAPPIKVQEEQAKLKRYQEELKAALKKNHK